jgi:uroporphyrinogen-III decarboxylase
MRGNILKLSEESADILIIQAGSKAVPGVEAQRFAPKPDDESRWELVDYVVDKLGATHYIIGSMSGDTIWYPSGTYLEPWLLRMVEDPDRMAEQEQKDAAGLRGRARTFLDRGCDAVMLGGDYGTEIGPFMSPATFRRALFPGLKARCGAARDAGSPVFFHACGNNRLILDQMVEAGIDVWQAIQPVNRIDEVKTLYGHRLTLWAGVNTQLFNIGTPDEIRREARWAVERCAPGGGFILGSSHSIMVGAKYDNFMAMVETAHQSGK